MIKTLATLLALLGLLLTAWWVGGGFVILAQTLPITKTVIWDANDASEGVLFYSLGLDDEPRMTINAPAHQGSVTFRTPGVHVIKVNATNFWATSADTTLTVTVIAPSSPTGVTIQ